MRRLTGLTMSEHDVPLLITKLYQPQARANAVSREPLLRRLDAGLGGKLIAVLAAAGFGKTTLLADWCASHDGQVAWLSLDEGDNHPARFLTYVLAALQTCVPDVLQSLPYSGPLHPPFEPLLYGLVNALAAVQQPVILVLDDYHIIDNAQVHAVVTFLLDNLSPNVTFVVASRTDPPLHLSRLRARGELLELRAADLRFTTEDAARFLNVTMGLDLTGETVAALESRTEGWVAGLHLAALALRDGSADAETFVRDFSGSHRFVLDYLLEEVLARQPEDLRAFLLQTSFLRQMNPDLCDAVTGDSNAHAMLETLVRNNLFLVPLDINGYWYRYHHLFADLLRARMAYEDGALLRTLQVRAAHWHASHDMPEVAVSYALAGGDVTLAADLIAGAAATAAYRGDVTLLMDWYLAFPANYVVADARLASLFGMAFALNGRWQEAGSLLGATSGAHDANYPAVLLRAYLLPNVDDMPDVEALLTADLPDYSMQMLQAIVASVHGDMRAASDQMALAQAAAERAGDETQALIALFHRCRLDVLLGALTQAEAEARGALRRLTTFGTTALPTACLAHVTLGRVAIERDDLLVAEAHLLQALQLAEQTGVRTGFLSSATLMLAETQQAAGEAAAAASRAERAVTLAQQFDPPAEVEWLRVYQARIWLLQGNVTPAAQWLRAAEHVVLPPSKFYPRNIDTVTRARVHLALRQVDEAIALLMRVTADPPNLLTVEAYAALAIARQAQGDHVSAGLALGQALALAEPEARLRPFLDLGAPLHKLLAKLVETQPHQAFARTVLDHFPRLDEQSDIDPLSEREREVLRLIAAGYTNDEIAQALTLAISTVKWYVNVIYGKLHVSNRVQAIVRAQALGLTVP